MKFRTEVFPEHQNLQLSHSDYIMAIGSCFAENIGNCFQTAFFSIDINPFGVLYNPSSILQALEFIIEGRIFEESDLQHFNNKWFSFFHHGSFSSTQIENALSKINERIIKSHNQLTKTKVLFITFGTAWVYRYKKSNKVVSNCHKLPAVNFERTRLNIDELVNDYTELIAVLKKQNPHIRIVFTVSPVRHWKDGANGNQTSKAVLLLAIEQLCAIKNVSYFPSYELVIDDLRDYRFFEDDMLHPSPLAVDYIWGKISDTYFNNQTKQLIGRLNKIYKAAMHRPLFPKSQSHKDFIITQIDVVEKLKNEHPEIDFSTIINKLSTQID